MPFPPWMQLVFTFGNAKDSPLLFVFVVKNSHFLTFEQIIQIIGAQKSNENKTFAYEKLTFVHFSCRQPHPKIVGINFRQRLFCVQDVSGAGVPGLVEDSLLVTLLPSLDAPQ